MTRISIKQKVLERNIRMAEGLKQRFQAEKLLVLNLIGTPGAGKTSLLENTLNTWQGKIKAGVIAGDVQTRNDADRLSGFGAPVTDIRTEGACHLDAAMIDRAVNNLPIDRLDVLFIENVGNLVCPADYDLGEAMKVTVISVTEGDDKPEKYPAMFARSGVVVINKIDLLPYTNFSLETARGHLLSLNPNLKIFTVSCSTGEGLDSWFDFLDNALKQL